MLLTLLAICACLEVGQVSASPPGDESPKQEISARLAAIGNVDGITRPHREATLGSIQPARITELTVSEGQLVEQGTLLVVLDDGVQRVRVEKAEAEAKSLIAIELALVKMTQASLDLERIRELMGDDSASNKELQDIQAIADTTRLKYEEARFEHELAVRDHTFQRLLFERFHLRAPFTGYIIEVFKEEGETVQVGEDILRIVALNPLIVSLDCPLHAARAIKVGSRVAVHPVDTRLEARVAEVIYASPVIDPASQTMKVKLRVDNGDGGWISGQKVRVDFAAPLPGVQVLNAKSVSDMTKSNEFRTVSKHE